MKAIQAALIGGVALAMILVGFPIHAQAATPPPCGTVVAYTAATATTPGSLTIGQSTFAIAAGATSPSGGSLAGQINVGSPICLNGQFNSAGALTIVGVSPGNVGSCGAASAYVPATSTATGSLTLLNGPAGFAAFDYPIAAGVALTAAQVTGRHCYTITINGQGVGQISGYLSPQDAQSTATGAPTAAAASNAPSGTVVSLPTTSTPTATPNTPVDNTVTLLALLLIGGAALTVLALRRRTTH